MIRFKSWAASQFSVYQLPDWCFAAIMAYLGIVQNDWDAVLRGSTLFLLLITLLRL